MKTMASYAYARSRLCRARFRVCVRRLPCVCSLVCFLNEIGSGALLTKRKLTDRSNQR